MIASNHSVDEVLRGNLLNFNDEQMKFIEKVLFEKTENQMTFSGQRCWIKELSGGGWMLETSHEKKGRQMSKSNYEREAKSLVEAMLNFQTEKIKESEERVKKLEGVTLAQREKIKDWIKNVLEIREKLDKAEEKIKDLEETIKQKDKQIINLQETIADLLNQINARDKRIDELHSLILSKKLG